MNDMEMLPEWAGRKSGSAQSPTEERWAPPRLPDPDAGRPGSGEGDDEFIILEPEEEPATTLLVEAEPDAAAEDETSAPVGAAAPTRGSGRWLALLAVASVLAGLAAGYIFLLVTG